MKICKPVHLRRVAIFLALLLCATAYGQRVIRTSTTRDLVRNIASDRTIVLEAGEYYLLEAEGIQSEYVEWESVFDGPQLVIHDVENFTILGEEGATILTEPRYSYVLSFRDSRGIHLENLSISHTEAGYCIGGVVRLERCEEVALQSCGLFGSGTVGIDILDSLAVQVGDSLISECTYGAVYIEASADVIFTDTELSGNEAWPLIHIAESSQVSFDSCWIGYNYGDALLSVDEYSYPVLFQSVIFEANETDFFAYQGSPLPDLSACLFTGNSFAEEIPEEIGELEQDR